MYGMKMQNRTVFASDTSEVWTYVITHQVGDVQIL